MVYRVGFNPFVCVRLFPMSVPLDPLSGIACVGMLTVSVLQLPSGVDTEVVKMAKAAFKKGSVVDLVKLVDYVATSGGTYYQFTRDASEVNVQLCFATILRTCVKDISFTTEELGRVGRADATVVMHNGKRVVIEFKVEEEGASAMATDTAVRLALAQIKNKRYRSLGSFKNDGRDPNDVVGYGFVFDKKLRLLRWGEQTGDNGEVIVAPEGDTGDRSVSEASRV